VAAFARYDELGVDRTFIGQLHFPGGLLAQFDSSFAAPDRERIEIVGGEATLVLDSPFLPEPDGPPPSLTMWRGRESRTIEVQSIDQYRAEVDDLTAAILDGSPPRVDLAFSRGTVATIVDLNRAARSTALAAATSPSPRPTPTPRGSTSQSPDPGDGPRRSSDPSPSCSPAARCWRWRGRGPQRPARPPPA